MSNENKTGVNKKTKSGRVSVPVKPKFITSAKFTNDPAMTLDPEVFATAGNRQRIVRLEVKNVSRSHEQLMSGLRLEVGGRALTRTQANIISRSISYTPDGLYANYAFAIAVDNNVFTNEKKVTKIVNGKKVQVSRSKLKASIRFNDRVITATVDTSAKVLFDIIAANEFISINRDTAVNWYDSDDTVIPITFKVKDIYHNAMGQDVSDVKLKINGKPLEKTFTKELVNPSTEYESKAQVLYKSQVTLGELKAIIGDNFTNVQAPYVIPFSLGSTITDSKGTSKELTEVLTNFTVVRQLPLSKANLSIKVVDEDDEVILDDKEPRVIIKGRLNNVRESLGEQIDTNSLQLYLNGNLVDNSKFIFSKTLAEDNDELDGNDLDYTLDIDKSSFEGYLGKGYKDVTYTKLDKGDVYLAGVEVKLNLIHQEFGEEVKVTKELSANRDFNIKKIYTHKYSVQVIYRQTEEETEPRVDAYVLEDMDALRADLEEKGFIVDKAKYSGDDTVEGGGWILSSLGEKVQAIRITNLKTMAEPSPYQSKNTVTADSDSVGDMDSLFIDNLPLPEDYRSEKAKTELYKLNGIDKVLVSINNYDTVFTRNAEISDESVEDDKYTIGLVEKENGLSEVSFKNTSDKPVIVRMVYDTNSEIFSNLGEAFTKYKVGTLNNVLHFIAYPYVEPKPVELPPEEPVTEDPPAEVPEEKPSVYFDEILLIHELAESENFTSLVSAPSDPIPVGPAPVVLGPFVGEELEPGATDIGFGPFVMPAPIDTPPSDMSSPKYVLRNEETNEVIAEGTLEEIVIALDTNEELEAELLYVTTKSQPDPFVSGPGFF